MLLTEYSFTCRVIIHILQRQTTSFSRIKHQATIYKLCNKLTGYKSPYQNSRGPTKHKNNHCLSTGNKNVLLALALPFSKVWMGKNEAKTIQKACVDENLLLCIHKVKMIRFQKRISVVQALVCQQSLCMKWEEVL